MSKEQYDYPEDEFDVAGRNRGPNGAHRTPRPLWRALLPFLVVLVAAPLLAWGLVTLIGGQDEPAPQATSQAEEEPAEEE
ncbi:hypothetical protein PU560_01175, partial [Georgenia sp. 10Sc9-8]|nr:hypothetical protein [Georgenia halotolerans]